MSEQWYASIRRLNPPVVVAGKAYPLAIAFRDPWADRDRGEALIASLPAGTMEAVNDLDGRLIQIVCARGMKKCSRTVPRGVGDSMELETEHLCGGNVASTAEPLRVYSWNEPTSARGSDGRTRALPGDVLRVNGEGPGYLIVEANAMAISPIGGVAWQGAGYGLVVWRFENGAGRMELEVEDNATLVLEGLGVFDGLEGKCCGGSPETETTIARKIWVVNGTAQPEWYPPDAKFDGGSARQYWIDPLGYSIVLSDMNFHIYENGAGDRYRLRYWTRGLASYEVETGQRLGVKPAGGCSYGGVDGDAVYIAGEGVLGNCDRVITIEGGAGAVEWRRPIGTSSNPRKTQVAALRWTIAGGQAAIAATGGGARFDPDGTFYNWTLAGGTYSFPFEIRVLKSGANVELYHRQHSPDGWVAAVTSVMTGVVAATDGIVGLVGMDASGARAAGPWDAQAIELGQTGQLLKWRELVAGGVLYSRAAALHGATALVSVENVTTGEMMSAVNSEPHGRDEYALVLGVVYVWSECAGDRIRVTQAAPAGTPAKPGEWPRVFGIVNAATGESSDPEENRLNWHDELVVADPQGFFAGVAGATFTVDRLAMFDPRNPPGLQWDLKGDTGRTWETMAAGIYLGRWADGVVLLEAEWLAGLGEDARACARGFGKAFLQSCGWMAEAYNDLRRVIVEVGEEVWHSLGLLGSDAQSLMGCVYLPDWGPSAYDGDGVPTALAFGTGSTVIADNCYNWIVHGVGGARPPGWRGGQMPPGTLATFWEETPWIWPAPNPAYIVPDEFIFWVRPGAFGTDYFGSAPSIVPAFFGGTGFQFTGCPFFPANPWLAGLEGAEIIEARAMVRVTNPTRQVWSLYEYQSPNGLDSEITIVINGTTVYHRKVVNGIETEFHNEAAPIVEGARIGFSLIGRRKNTTGVWEFQNPALAQSVDASFFRHFGSGPAMNVPANVWTQIDITGAARGAMRAARSAIVDMFFWPNAGVQADESAGNMVGYLKSLLPARSITIIRDPPLWGWTITMSGAYTQFEAIEIKDPFFRYRLPSGILEKFFLPTRLGPTPAR